jgi:hypothetical protein
MQHFILPNFFRESGLTPRFYRNSFIASSPALEIRLKKDSMANDIKTPELKRPLSHELLRKMIASGKSIPSKVSEK